jgi:hypothetical protein
VSHRTKHLLNGTGLLLAVIGFYLSQTSTYSWIGQFVAPAATEAKRTLERLAPGETLADGFALRTLAGAISETDAGRKVKLNPRDVWKVQRGVPTADFGMSGLQQRLPLLVYLRGKEQPGVLDYAVLMQRLEDNASARATLCSSIVFWLGVIVTGVTSFVPEKDRPGANCRAAQR